jgi:hypothetical protein
MQIITTNAPQAAPAVKGVPAATGILRAELPASVREIHRGLWRAEGGRRRRQ